jgi:hypothetical protein
MVHMRGQHASVGVLPLYRGYWDAWNHNGRLQTLIQDTNSAWRADIVSQRGE